MMRVQVKITIGLGSDSHLRDELRQTDAACRAGRPEDSHSFCKHVSSVYPSLQLLTKPGHPRCSDGLGSSNEAGVTVQRTLVRVLVRRESPPPPFFLFTVWRSEI